MIHSGRLSPPLWDKVIAQDFFQQFDQKNLLAGDTPMCYRHVVLEPGGSESANDLVKNFLGRPQNTEAFKNGWARSLRASPKGTIRVSNDGPELGGTALLRNQTLRPGRLVVMDW